MGVNEGNLDCLVEKREVLGLKKAKNQGFVFGSKAVGGGVGVHGQKLSRKSTTQIRKLLKRLGSELWLIRILF